MKYRRKLWAGIGMAILLAASGATSGLLAPSAARADILKVSMEEESEVRRVADDPLLYLSELDLIRAFYLAGEALLDVEGSRKAAGSMFVEPFFEGYGDLEPVLAARGGAPFGDEMIMTMDLAREDAPVAEVKAAVARVYAALDAAEKVAPKSGKERLGAEVTLTAIMLARAATQYEMALSPTGPEEAWAGGYGIWKAAERRSNALLPKLEGVNDGLAADLAAARKVFGDVYRSVTEPETTQATAEALREASTGLSEQAKRF
ncbi:hypothetical protein [Parvibaculum sp.]|uniref:hypothetical protein n=1 Tax=Parvibaculum sp. TaxID=2024848 RepID=UPI003C77A5E8